LSFCALHNITKLSLFCSFNWAPRHEGVLGEWRYSSTHSLTSALDGVEWSTSRLGRFIPREKAPGTPWIGGWVSPRAVLDAVAKRKIPNPHRESNPRTPIVQPVAQRYTDWAIAALPLQCNPSNKRNLHITSHTCGVRLDLIHAFLTVMWRLRMLLKEGKHKGKSKVDPILN
jgi:hypothetical protein